MSDLLKKTVKWKTSIEDTLEGHTTIKTRRKEVKLLEREGIDIRETVQEFLVMLLNSVNNKEIEKPKVASKRDRRM